MRCMMHGMRQGQIECLPMFSEKIKKSSPNTTGVHKTTYTSRRKCACARVCAHM